MKTLSVGFGYVGKAYGVFLREQGHEVFAMTKNDTTRQDARKYGFPQVTKRELGTLDAAVIAVPTPTTNGKFILSILDDAVSKAVQYAPNIIIKSTVLPGTTAQYQKQYPKNQFFFYPEFLEAAQPFRDVFNQKITVFGNDSWNDKKRGFIKELLKGKRFDETDYTTAESLKYFHNLWLASNISFWNAMIKTSSPNIDVNFILKQVHKSDKFGTYPWTVGVHFGGACLPKDLEAHISTIPDGSKFKGFLQEIKRVNDLIRKEHPEKVD